MDEFPTYKKTAFRYWERRRAWYNLALVPPTILSYLVATALNYAGNPPQPDVPLLLVLLALSVLGANICYSFAYALEFVFAGNGMTSWWLRYGRTAFFVAGILFAMILAVMGGSNIAGIEYDHHFG